MEIGPDDNKGNNGDSSDGGNQDNNDDGGLTTQEFRENKEPDTSRGSVPLNG